MGAGPAAQRVCSPGEMQGPLEPRSVGPGGERGGRGWSRAGQTGGDVKSLWAERAAAGAPSQGRGQREGAARPSSPAPRCPTAAVRAGVRTPGLSPRRCRPRRAGSRSPRVWDSGLPLPRPRRLAERLGPSCCASCSFSAAFSLVATRSLSVVDGRPAAGAARAPCQCSGTGRRGAWVLSAAGCA